MSDARRTLREYEDAPSEETAFQRERRERAEAKAARLRARSEASFDAARAEAAQIPMGQPILVGHHSERKHRRALERHDARMRAGFELAEAAETADAAARAASSRILAEDPEALRALREKLAGEEAELAEWKRARKAWSKAYGAGGVEAGVAALRSAGLEALIPEALNVARLGDYWARQAFSTTNRAANVRRIRERIAQLEAEGARAPAEPVEGDGWTIEEDPDACRIRVRFAARTSPEVHALMRRHGFVFSRSEGAYQRKLNPAGRTAAKLVTAAIAPLPAPAGPARATPCAYCGDTCDLAPGHVWTCLHCKRAYAGGAP